MIEDGAPDNAPDWLAAALDRGEAQIESGQTVPIEPVPDRLRASIARMQGRAEQEPRREM